ncbi:DUF3105 domain-containing protein [Longimycelium tulufanense]|nr:DUF3105 domain-containing protein [Longimycelium tulufanense]
MPSSKKNKSSRALREARSAMTSRRSKPWGTVAAVVAVLVFAAGIFGYVYNQHSENQAREARLAQWTPSSENKDPSTQIPGVVVQEYKEGQHVSPAQRVAYDKNPPFGGPHDGFWAACNGVVYDNPVRTENLVHSLEHGAVWIAYDPEKVRGAALDTLRRKAEGQPFMVMSPYPGLGQPISLQSWGHQLKLESADDERIDQFVRSLRRNQYTYPETGATCNALGPGQFDPDNPPPFDPTPPGPDAVPMTGSGAAGGRGGMDEPEGGR